MNIVKNTIFLWSVIPSLVFANSYIGTHKTYTVSENLFIDLNKDEAIVSGQFIFRSATHADRHHSSEPALLTVPVWIPIPAHLTQDVSRLKDLAYRYHRNLAEKIDLKVSINEKAITYTDFSASVYRDSAEEDENKKDIRNNVYAAEFTASFNSAVLTNDVRVSLSYKQPLIKSDGETLLFYVPFLLNMKERYLEENSDNYRITVRCSDGYEIHMKSDVTFPVPPTTKEIVIMPQHRKQILVELKKKANQSSEPTLKTPGDSVDV
jgi:hypothetical protein